MSYEEKRVKVSQLGTTPASSPLLVEIPGVGGPRKLHKLAAQSFQEMAAAIHRDLGIVAKAASAWRPHRWTSRKQYEDRLIAKYGSVKEGRRWLAFDSPHETGLAVDFGVGGLEPVCNTVAKQRATPLHHWLVAHAHEYGWHPYKVEPWHWEYPLSLAEFQTGERGAADDAAGPVSFGGHGDDDEAEGFIEEMDAESARWFAGEPDEQPPARTAVVAPRSEAAPDPALRSGEVDGEVEVGAARVRFRVRWRVG
jgi:hypothetical protein